MTAQPESLWTHHDIRRKQGRPIDADRHVGARIRERRIMLGLTQSQMADLIGVTYQQAHKYEKGINRVSAGRLYGIAQYLGVDVGYFYEGMGSDKALKATPQNRAILALTTAYVQLTSKERHIVNTLVHELANRNG
jgi:transcriptional regulator with XRE-family HTH domain